MWHGPRKPSFSSFFWKFCDECVRKNSTCEVRKNLTKFQRSTTWRGGKPRKVFWVDHVMSWFDYKIDARKPKASRSLGEVDGGLRRLPWQLNDENRAISSGRSRQTVVKFFVTSLSSWISSGVFSHAFITEFSEKTWNQRFSTCVSYLEFIVLWDQAHELVEKNLKKKVFDSPVISRVYWSISMTWSHLVTDFSLLSTNANLKLVSAQVYPCQIQWNHLFSQNLK